MADGDPSDFGEQLREIQHGPAFTYFNILKVVLPTICMRDTVLYDAMPSPR